MDPAVQPAVDGDAGPERAVATAEDLIARQRPRGSGRSEGQARERMA